MNIKEETREILTNPPGDMPYICFKRYVEGESWPQIAFIIPELTGNLCFYLGNVFAAMETGVLPPPKKFSSVEEVIADGWEVD